MVTCQDQQRDVVTGRVVANNPATLCPIQFMGLDQEFEVFAGREGALVGAAGL